MRGRLFKSLKGIRLEDVTTRDPHPCYWYAECGKAGVYGGRISENSSNSVVACEEHAERLKGVNNG